MPSSGVKGDCCQTQNHLRSAHFGSRLDRDLVLAVGSAAGLQRLLEVVSKICEWSGERIKLAKSVITAFDYRALRELLQWETPCPPCGGREA